MSLYEAAFKVKHECPYRSISEEHPALTIREWFMNEQQMLEISSGQAPTQELVETVEDLGTMLFETTDSENLYAVVQSSRCSLDDSLIARFEDHNCLYLPPTIYREGWEQYTVTAFDDRDVRGLLGDLEGDREIEVLSTQAIETRRVPHSLFMTADSLFGDLTPRQLEALRIALDSGYFDQPRGASVAELAERTSVSRSTFEEHLRKAENKLIGNTQNLLRLLTETSTEKNLLEDRPRAVSS